MIVPNLSRDVRTYQIVAPRSTHFRPATCAEMQCSGYVNGWKTVLPAGDPRVDYIRSASGRRFTEQAGDGIVTFAFEPGQQCFSSADHVISLERDPHFRVRENSLTRTHTRGDLWQEDFAGHLDKVKKIREG